MVSRPRSRSVQLSRTLTGAHGTSGALQLAVPDTKDQDPFAAIDDAALANVQGGASRVTAPNNRSNAEIVQMLRTITQSIKNLAGKAQSSPMQQMLPMMGGTGGAPTSQATTPLGATSGVGSRRG